MSITLRFFEAATHSDPSYYYAAFPYIASIKVTFSVFVAVAPYLQAAQLPKKFALVPRAPATPVHVDFNLNLRLITTIILIALFCCSESSHLGSPAPSLVSRKQIFSNLDFRMANRILQE